MINVLSSGLLRNFKPMIMKIAKMKIGISLIKFQKKIKSILEYNFTRGRQKCKDKL